MDSEAPLLSIVTGTRNRPDLIADMVNSVLAHTKHPFELLIADGSDGEPFVCNDPRVRVFPETEPLGSVRAYNAVFEQAQGDFVCFLNDDLVVLPGWSVAIFDDLRSPSRGGSRLYPPDGAGRAGAVHCGVCPDPIRPDGRHPQGGGSRAWLVRRALCHVWA